MADISKLSTIEIISAINAEDNKIASEIGKAIPSISSLCDLAFNKISSGGRIFYIGSGTSGRLGVLDASEIYPTYGIEGMIIAIIAGGDIALKNPVEAAEDNILSAWEDLQCHNITISDFVIGVSASGSTPFVTAAIEKCKSSGIITGSITCSLNSKLEQISDFPIVINTGEEFVNGSTRMKAGTATKMVLNMISTTLMIKLGRVFENKMADMIMLNKKLKNRGVEIIMNKLKLDRIMAETLLEEHKNVRKILELYSK